MSVLQTSAYEDTDVAFLLPVRPGKKIRIRIDPRMYSIKPETEANWVWHAFRGFGIVQQQLFAAGVRPQTFAAIGTGSGVDAIGASLFFPSLRRLIVTDVEDRIVWLAAENVRMNVSDELTVEGFVGDVCLPLAKAGSIVDVIYTNLPNIPITHAAEGIIDHGTFYHPADDNVDDHVLEQYLLGLQYRFLLSAKRVLSKRGFVIMMIGGRVPYEMFDRLASAAGYRFEEVLCCLKLQTEAKNVASGYAAAEREGIEFDFYKFDQASAALSGARQLNGRELKQAIRTWRMSAGEAAQYLKSGKKIGPTLHFFKGTPLNA
jgi:methylase of polypeptide subunit release factors